MKKLDDLIVGIVLIAAALFTLHITYPTLFRWLISITAVLIFIGVGATIYAYFTGQNSVPSIGKMARKTARKKRGEAVETL